MGVLKDIDSLSFLRKLMDRGLTSDQIDRAMKQMVGSDWSEIHSSLWFKRLKSQGYVLQDEHQLSVNDLEALINGRLMLDDLGRQEHDGNSV